MMLKQTVDTQVNLLKEKLNLPKESEDAPDTKKENQSLVQDIFVAQAAREGSSALTSGG
jgi:hypothetical protein